MLVLEQSTLSYYQKQLCEVFADLNLPEICLLTLLAAIGTTRYLILKITF